MMISFKAKKKKRFKIRYFKKVTIYMVGVYQSAWAAITKNHRPSDLNNRNTYPHSP